MDTTTLQEPALSTRPLTVSVSAEKVQSQTFGDPSVPAQAPSRWESFKWEWVTGSIPDHSGCQRTGSAVEQEQLYASV